MGKQHRWLEGHSPHTAKTAGYSQETRSAGLIRLAVGFYPTAGGDGYCPGGDKRLLRMLLGPSAIQRQPATRV